MPHLPQILRTLLERSERTRNQIAADAGLTSRTLRGWLSGDVLPTEKSLRRLTTSLGVDWLMVRDAYLRDHFEQIRNGTRPLPDVHRQVLEAARVPRYPGTLAKELGLTARAVNRAARRLRALGLVEPRAKGATKTARVTPSRWGFALLDGTEPPSAPAPAPRRDPVAWKEVIETRRAELDLELAELAQRVGVSAETAENWGTNQRMPTEARMGQIAAVLELDPRALLALLDRGPDPSPPPRPPVPRPQEPTPAVLVFPLDDEP